MRNAPPGPGELETDMKFILTMGLALCLATPAFAAETTAEDSATTVTITVTSDSVKAVTDTFEQLIVSGTKANVELDPSGANAETSWQVGAVRYRLTLSGEDLAIHANAGKKVDSLALEATSTVDPASGTVTLPGKTMTFDPVEGKFVEVKSDGDPAADTTPHEWDFGPPIKELIEIEMEKQSAPAEAPKAPGPESELLELADRIDAGGTPAAQEVFAGIKQAADTLDNAVKVLEEKTSSGDCPNREQYNRLVDAYTAFTNFWAEVDDKSTDAEIAGLLREMANQVMLVEETSMVAARPARRSLKERLAELE